jgi:hypothetical protein
MQKLCKFILSEIHVGGNSLSIFPLYSIVSHMSVVVEDSWKILDAIGKWEAKYGQDKTLLMERNFDELFGDLEKFQESERIFKKFSEHHKFFLNLEKNVKNIEEKLIQVLLVKSKNEIENWRQKLNSAVAQFTSNVTDNLHFLEKLRNEILKNFLVVKLSSRDWFRSSETAGIFVDLSYELDRRIGNCHGQKLLGKKKTKK